ncbi:biosynthetic-type acetolactate synthase large subunit [Draconibacterium halophilum]|uniref:Acetolactate synthase n=1 Tax=Draconibacterium halophilum TaxID=2706887 RepID=A0A6C0RB52_9BACT|nr:biosynthetic-type acetolactate synthase large subunit [Draconibacterium halophilum]QIA07868.1 biosynthetic-type acetolactate synthase large subunit [Draconibacterium halophilum]
MTAKKITGSQALILSLMEEGVDTIFGYPGGAIMPIYDALYDFDKEVKHILTRHEQGAIHGAQGYARVSGKPGIVFATSGPGATNLMTGIADAMIDSTPLVCITGQVASPLLGTDAFQESDIVGMSIPVTKWNYQITTPEEIPEVMAQAFYIATTGRPGPVLIDVTKDAQFGELEYKYEKCKKIRSYVPETSIDPHQIKAAADLINEAKKPLLFVGQGIIISHAEEEVRTFIEKTGIPAAWTLLGLSALPTDHRLNVGMLGMHGNYGPNKLTNEADLIIAVGMRFDDRVTGKVSEYAKKAKIIHIEIDPAEIDKIVKTDVSVLADAKKALKMLIDNVNPNNHENWHNEFKKCDAIENEKVIQKDLYPTKPGLTMGEAVRIASEKTNHDAVLVTDVGQHQMVAQRYFHFKNSRSNVTSGGLGTMGFCLPASMGAQLGAPNRTVIAAVGDGGFQMTIQELGTIAQNKLPVKIMLLNNNFLGMVRQWQQLFFDKRYSFTELHNPDFITIGKGFGIEGHTVDKREDLDASIQKMIDHDGPYLLEIKIEKEDNVFPMVPTGASVSDIILEP